MGESNVKSLVLLTQDIKSIVDFLVDHGYSSLPSAERINIELNLRMQTGSIYVVPRAPKFDPSIMGPDMGPNMGPNFQC